MNFHGPASHAKSGSAASAGSVSVAALIQGSLRMQMKSRALLIFRASRNRDDSLCGLGSGDRFHVRAELEFIGISGEQLFSVAACGAPILLRKGFAGEISLCLGRLFFDGSVNA